jgi:hypothetical protein
VPIYQAYFVALKVAVWIATVDSPETFAIDAFAIPSTLTMELHDMLFNLLIDIL